MYHALRNTDHMAFIQGAGFSLSDGVGVIAAGYFWGSKIKRYNGPILQLERSVYVQSCGWRHFYYGGKEGVADIMAAKLKQQFPQLNVVGTYCPPFRALTPAEDDEVAAM
jgi:N-acetylglucosaminyldiphosphoundecaprenol N-acetyl-beta-D-mannosaminyltransferase